MPSTTRVYTNTIDTVVGEQATTEPPSTEYTDKQMLMLAVAEACEVRRRSRSEAVAASKAVSMAEGSET